MQMTRHIVTDESMMELAQHGTADFPLQYYLDDIALYDASHIGRHWHREIELVIASSGAVTCLIGNMKIPLSVGEGIFINSGVIHGFETCSEGMIPNVLFSPEFLAPVGSRIYDRYVEPLITSNTSHAVFRHDVIWQAAALRDLREMFELCEARQGPWEMGVQSHIQLIWAALVSNRADCVTMDVAGISRLSQARLRRMTRFIEGNYAQPLSLSDIAQCADISRSEALRCFRIGMQTSPVNYLNQHRLAIARELLLTTAQSITDIAQSVGYESTSYFDRQFRRAFGTTPRQTRANAYPLQASMEQSE